MTISTKLTELLEIEHPVLLAPMGGVSGGALAGAVTAAGGLGLIGGGYGDADWIEAAFETAGNQRVGIGFITWSLANQPELLDLALAHEPVCVMLSFGAVEPFAAKIRDAGCKLICQVQSVADARVAVAAGADLIVAQGTEAGGHGAERTTFTLVPAVVDAVAPVPVAAAGGVADGRGLAAALMLGADGVLVGTRFYAAAEALGHDSVKQRIVAQSGNVTRRTTVFDIVRGRDWPARYTGRAIANDFLDRWHGSEAGLVDKLPSEQAAYEAADRVGDADTLVAFAGECVDLIHDIAPAAELVARMVAEAETALDRG